jgi:sugar lactone lactonase YvrE
MIARRLLVSATAIGLLAWLGLISAMAAQAPDAYVLPGDAVFPEGIAFDAQSQSFYVSSTNGGAIYRGTLNEEETEVFLQPNEGGRTSATGLEVDDGRLFVSGGGTGRMFVYDAESGELLASFTASRTPTFINDVAVVDGSAYFTDSLSPVVYRVFQGPSGWEIQEWVDFTGTDLAYTTGFNANGIEAAPGGQYLVIVQSNTGKLFRVELASKDVSEIDLGGETVMAGDGMVLRGRTLWVVRNSASAIAKIQLSGDLLSGRLLGETVDESLAFPTTAVIANGSMLVVNSQFDKRGPGLTPELPFTVSRIAVP